MKLYQGQPGTGDTLLFTAERRLTHLTITTTNTTGTDATLTLNVAYQGAAAATTNQLLGTQTIPANRTGLFELGLVLEAGDTIRGAQGTSGAITVLIDGLDIGKDSRSRGSSFSLFPPPGATSGGGGGTTSPLTTKGDIWTFSTVDARLPIGTNGQFLQADSAQTSGNGWKTVSGDATLATGGALTLATVNANTGAKGDTLNALTITTNGKGLVTAVSTTALEPYAAQSQASAATIDYTTARVHQLTMTGNVTITLSGATNNVACAVSIYLVQDGTGGRTITWPGSVKWPGGVPPILSVAASARDLVVLESVDGGTTWFGNLAGLGYA